MALDATQQLLRAISDNDGGEVDRIITNAKGTTLEKRLLAEGLYTSSEQNRLDIVQRLTSHGADLTRQAGKATDRVPILVAAQSDNEHVVRHLLENDQPRQGRDYSNKEKLLRQGIAIARSKSVAKLLIDHCKDLGAKDLQGKTVLLNVRNADVVELLLEKRVDVEAKDGAGSSALMRSIIRDENPAVANVLMEKGGASIHSVDNEGRTMLIQATWMGRVELLTTLLERGAGVHVSDHRGRNALHHLASSKRTYEYRPDVKKGDQQDRDSQILDKLLAAGLDPKQTDNRGRTALHWAASLRCSGVLKLLLQTRRFEKNAQEHRSKAPLHFAANNGDIKSVEMLLGHGGMEIDLPSDGDWTPLHFACLATSDPVAVVRRLISNGADVNRKTQIGQTPLHVAAEAGNVAIVRYLLQETNAGRTTRDGFGNTPLLGVSKVQHENRDEIVRLFAPSVRALPEAAKDAAQQWEATIVDFTGNRKPDQKPDSKLPKTSISTASVFDLLYKKHANKVDEPHMAAFDKKNAAKDDFRWIHFPANNVAWCLDLFTKYFIENGARARNSFKALERSFNNQHRGDMPQARYMTPLCQTVVRPWGSEESDLIYGTEHEPLRKATEDSFEEQSLSRITSREMMPASPSRQSSTAEPLGSGNPNAKTSESSTVRKPVVRRGTNLLDDGNPTSDFYIFMPYLHFETYDRLVEMASALSGPALPASAQNISAREANTTTDAVPHQRASNVGGDHSACKDIALFRAYLNVSDDREALHIRRTLDQSFYHHINTKERDKDQVIHRFQKQISKPDEPKIVMVDQLWLFVIGKLIVTAFPQRWRQPRKDALNVLQGILAIIKSANRAPVRSVNELAIIITGRCYGAYDRHGIGSDDPQFLDMFEGWIGAAMDDETRLFKRFKDDSTKASEWLQTDKSLKDFTSLDRDSRKIETSSTDTFYTIANRSYNPSRFTENLLDIGAETELLKEVKDIQDELEMLALILKHQQDIQPAMKNAIEAILGRDEQMFQTVKLEVDKAFADHERTILHPQGEVQRMQNQAKRMYDSLRDLLDLKQKHANALEARFARERTDETSEQGQTLMTFTVVTVIFLPLSFVAAVLAINIQGLPRTNGNQELPAHFVVKYILGIGISLAGVFVLIALYVSTFRDWYRKLRRWWRMDKSGRKAGKGIVKQAAEPIASHANDNGIGPSSGRNWRPTLTRARRKDIRTPDTEMGQPNHVKYA